MDFTRHLQIASCLYFAADFSTRTFCRCQFELAPSPFPHTVEVASLCSCGRDGSVKHACESHPRHLSLHYSPSLSVARGDATCIIHTCGCVWKRGRVPTRSPSHSLTPQTPERKTFHSLNVAAWSPAREAWLSHAQPPFCLRLPGLLPQTSTVFRPLMRLTPSTPQHLDSGLSGGDWRLAQQVSAL